MIREAAIAPEAPAEKPIEYSPKYREDDSSEMENLYFSVPDILEGTDPVRHEKDILYVLEVATKEFGIRDREALREWLVRQALNARRGYARSLEQARVFGQIPEVEQVASLLRSGQQLRATSRAAD